jgi:uncharacterized protein YjbJ (UPF0337 family)
MGSIPHLATAPRPGEIRNMNKLKFKGDWNIAKGKLKQRWGRLTDDDLRYQEGMESELIGRIQRRTGETQEAVEKAVEEVFSE